MIASNLVVDGSTRLIGPTYVSTINGYPISFENKGVTLSWGNQSTIATIGGVDIKVTMPSNPNSWRGIQDNLTSSTNTTESLSAKQGYLLANGSARDNTKVAKSGDTMTGTLTLKPASGEGGQINLAASTANTTQAGISIDQLNSTFRIFGIASADGTTKTGSGTALVIDPYAKTITGGYTLTGALSGNATTASRLAGFSSGGSVNSCSWGNQTGTAIYSAATSGGGGIFFRDNNPASGQVSMGIDGVFYQREGKWACIDTGNYADYALAKTTGTGSDMFMDSTTTNPYVVLRTNVSNNSDDVIVTRTHTGTDADPWQYPFYLHADGYCYGKNVCFEGGTIAGYTIVGDTGFMKSATMSNNKNSTVYFNVPSYTSANAVPYDVVWGINYDSNLNFIVRSNGQTEIYNNIAYIDKIQLKPGTSTRVDAVRTICNASGNGLYVQDSQSSVFPYYGFAVDASARMNLGGSSNRFTCVYLSSSPNVSSDRNLKMNISPFDSRYERAYMELAPCSYMLRNFSDDDHHDRLHYGFVAQDIQTVFNNNGITNEEMGFMCITNREFPNQAGEMTEYSLRYEELVALNTHMTQVATRRIETLEAEVAELRQLINELKGD